MNNFLYIPVLAALVIAGCKNSNIEINGKLENPETGEYIYLKKLKTTSLETVDSVQVKSDGTISFSEKIKSPSLYLLMTDRSNFMTMLLEPGQSIFFRSYFDSLNFPMYFGGSEGTILMIEYNRKLQETIKNLTRLGAVYSENLGKPELVAVMDSLENLGQAYLNEINSYTKSYIDQNLNSLVSLVALYQQIAPREYVISRERDFRYFVKVDSALYPLYPDYGPVQKLHEEVREMASALSSGNNDSGLLSEGSVAPDIALPGPSGDTIRLSSKRGKIVLLEFWASWCKPSRDENPNLVKAYDLYQNRGFEIYQVSLDKIKDAWLKAIREDRLERWTHVSDLKYWKSVVVPLYGLEKTPTSFLLDRDGRIVALNLRGDSLQARLAELLNR